VNVGRASLEVVGLSGRGAACAMRGSSAGGMTGASGRAAGMAIGASSIRGGAGAGSRLAGGIRARFADLDRAVAEPEEEPGRCARWEF